MAQENKWKEFEDPEFYDLENLGRPAIFLIPHNKLKTNIYPPAYFSDGKMPLVSCESFLQSFLAETFGAFTVTQVPVFGFWHNEKMVVYDECQQYEVSFVGKEKMKPLLRVLAHVSRSIKEECIYVKAGQYACLVKPVV
ncbi:MAG: hypothetical protein WC730_03780 [Patescibacteria group bacterium]|jgi:hypothetical protein